MASGMEPTGQATPAGSSVRPVGSFRGPSSSDADAGPGVGEAPQAVSSVRVQARAKWRTESGVKSGIGRALGALLWMDARVAGYLATEGATCQLC